MHIQRAGTGTDVLGLERLGELCYTNEWYGWVPGTPNKLSLAGFEQMEMASYGDSAPLVCILND